MIRINQDNKEEWIKKVIKKIKRGATITEALEYYNLNRFVWYEELTTEEKRIIKQTQLDYEQKVNKIYPPDDNS